MIDRGVDFQISFQKQNLAGLGVITVDVCHCLLIANGSIGVQTVPQIYNRETS
jgi:hypothetical protein